LPGSRFGEGGAGQFPQLVVTHPCEAGIAVVGDGTKRRDQLIALCYQPLH